MRHRKLRMAFSAVCGLACVLLIVLWVRSYRAHFDIRLPWSDHLLCSFRGWMQLLGESDPLTGIRRTEFPTPYWLPTGLAVTSSAVPWLPWSARFSLRTLLIATTLVAVVLGLAVYCSRLLLAANYFRGVV